MKEFIKIVLILLVVFGLIQFIPVDRENLSVKYNENFVEIYKTPKNIQKILQKACYDCHSNETNYPQYAYIAPISWSIKHHINKGRKHLNFSIWSTYNDDQKKGMLENAIADIEQDRMPLKGYIAQHPEAKLSNEEEILLINYFKNILKEINDVE